MDNFIEKMQRHAEHVGNVGVHCTTEETTKQALILPMLDALGFSPFDPTKVRAEWSADFPGAKHGERVDYALFSQGVPVMYIEAKAHAEKLSNHCAQLARYFNASPNVTVAAITNGREWRFFTDLTNKNVMDSEPFLAIDFGQLDMALLPRLASFRHDQFHPDALRILAEESIYLASFKEVIGQCLRAPDADFVRFVAGKAAIGRQFTARFVDSITPLVRAAIEQTVSAMVVSGLSSKADPVAKNEPNDTPRDIVDPSNPNIVTTVAEQRLLEVVKAILGDQAQIVAKDTESYFTILYQAKINRWLFRYVANRKMPYVLFPLELTDMQRHELERAGLALEANGAVQLPSPDHLQRISGLVMDMYAYCMNDDNFKRPTKSAESANLG